MTRLGCCRQYSSYCRATNKTGRGRYCIYNHAGWYWCSDKGRKTQPDPADLGLFFAARVDDAVDKHGHYIVGQVPPNETVRAMLGTALAFYQAWPTHLPKSPTTFRCTGMRPCDVHDCTGSQIWEACWGSRHEEITCDHYIPYQLLTILGELLQQAHPSVHCSEYSAKGAALYQAVAATAYRKLTA